MFKKRARNLLPQVGDITSAIPGGTENDRRHCDDEKTERPGLERLSDRELTAEVDKAWSRNDVERLEQLKGERARRRSDKAWQRAASDVKQGGISLCLFAGLMAVFVVLGTFKTEREVNLAALVIPAGLAGLSYYVFRGSRFAAVAGFTITLGFMLGDLRLGHSGAIWVGLEAGLVTCTWSAVRGSFALRKLASADGLAGLTPPPGPLPQGEGERLSQRE